MGQGKEEVYFYGQVSQYKHKAASTEINMARQEIKKLCRQYDRAETKVADIENKVANVENKVTMLKIR